jgi:hypothetical protein
VARIIIPEKIAGSPIPRRNAIATHGDSITILSELGHYPRIEGNPEVGMWEITLREVGQHPGDGTAWPT